jgi:transcriptional regulator with XRE-family HTH domain
VIGLGWTMRPRFGVWYFAYMLPPVVECGLISVSTFEYEDGRVRVFPGTRHSRPPVKLFRKPKQSSEDLQMAGRRLRMLRLSFPMTQLDLAIRLSRTENLNRYSINTIEQLISRFERGEHIGFPRLLVQAIESVLGSLDSGEVKEIPISVIPRTRTLHKLKRQRD